MPPKLPQTRARRGRPVLSEEQRESMKARISAVARSLFEQQGYAKISIRRIAKEIGCTPMTLYGYYDNKVDILRSLWGDVFEDLFKELESVVEEEDVEKYLHRLCLTYVEYWIDRPDSYRLVFMVEGVTQPEVNLFVGNPGIVAKYNLFSTAIQNLQCNNPVDDIKTKLDVLISTLHGIAHNKITMSGYAWAEPVSQIHYMIKGIS